MLALTVVPPMEGYLRFDGLLARVFGWYLKCVMGSCNAEEAQADREWIVNNYIYIFEAATELLPESSDITLICHSYMKTTAVRAFKNNSDAASNKAE